jgi:mRNA interferase RelE/StbE
VANYEVFIKPSALKELESIDNRKIRRNVAERIRALGENPRPPGCTKLTGSEGYRIRCDDYRVVYSIEDEQLVVFVVKIGHRKDVYR